MTNTPGAPWWPTLKALLGPQTSPPAVLSPALADTDARRLAALHLGRPRRRHGRDGRKPSTSGRSSEIFSIPARSSSGIRTTSPCSRPTRRGYQTFFNTYKNRRRVLYVGANDGLVHAFDAGVWDRTAPLSPTGDGCYDLGTGAELFAFAPRSIMQIYKPLKDAVGTADQTGRVDGGPPAVGRRRLH